jgi:hypothetical protein
MNLVETIDLPNGLAVEVWDASRDIAEDTTLVKIVFKMKIEIRKGYFTEPDQFEQVRKVFGTDQLYEYEKERTFVNTDDKEKVFSKLLGDFKRDSIPYLGHRQFPPRFARSKYNEIQKHYYRYRHLLEQQG